MHFSSCCETEMVDLLLGLYSLNIAQKMFLTHSSLFLVVKCTLSKSTLEKGVSVLSTCSPISCEVKGKAALKNVSHQICQAEPLGRGKADGDVNAIQAEQTF